MYVLLLSSCAGSPDHDLLAAGPHHGVQHEQGHREEVTLGAAAAVVTIQAYPILQTMLKLLISMLQRNI